MSSTWEKSRGQKQLEAAPRRKTSINGGANTVGDRNTSQSVVVNVHTGGAEALTDSERELLAHYRSTSAQGRLTIQQVAVLAASRLRRSKV